jgi:hypothetical protein
MRTGFLKKAGLCGLAGLLGLFAIHTDMDHRLPPGWSGLISALAFLFLGASVLYIVIWQYRETKKIADSANITAFWQGVIVYGEVLIFIRFGFLKLLGLHMNSSLILEDFPAGSISNYHMMDYFFNRAPEFKIIIGILQIAGAMCLLFRRTRMLGVFILLPIILNIALMDVLYDIEGGITIVAFALLLGLVYLLLQEKKKLRALFFKGGDSMPIFWTHKPVLKIGLKIAALILTLVILLPSVKRDKNETIRGKYMVRSQISSGQVKDIRADHDSLPAIVYFDENETCVLRYGDYRSLKIGRTDYNEATGKLQVFWRYPKTQKDTSFWQLIRSGSGQELIITGRTGAGNFMATLIKTPLPSVVIN